MNQRIKQLAKQCWDTRPELQLHFDNEKFAEMVIEKMHRMVIASILITDVVMEEKGQVPTSEDYIRAINKDFGVEK